MLADQGDVKTRRYALCGFRRARTSVTVLFSNNAHSRSVATLRRTR
jgi:hypothetical protein